MAFPGPLLVILLLTSFALFPHLSSAVPADYIHVSSTCFGARDSTFGTYSWHGYDRYYTHAYLRWYNPGGNGVSCSSGCTSSGGSHWGCCGPDLGAILTDTSNNVVATGVNAAGISTAGWYRWSGFDANSAELGPFAFTSTRSEVVGTNYLRLWFGEDLRGHTESDNGGRSCAYLYLKMRCRAVDIWPDSPYNPSTPVTAECPGGGGGTVSRYCTSSGWSSVSGTCNCPAEGIWPLTTSSWNYKVVNALVVRPCPDGQMGQLRRFCFQDGWQPVENHCVPAHPRASVSRFTSAADIDFQGNFVYAINLGANAGSTQYTIGDATFVPDDDECSATLNTTYRIHQWGDKEYQGEYAEELRWVMNGIRYNWAQPWVLRMPVHRPPVRRYRYHSTYTVTETNSWASSSSHCSSRQGPDGRALSLCPRYEVCPDGPFETPRGGVRSVDEWTPVLDASNMWVSIGNYDTSVRMCRSHRCALDSAPSWGTTSTAYGYKGIIMCCETPTEGATINPTCLTRDNYQALAPTELQDVYKVQILCAELNGDRGWDVYINDELVQKNFGPASVQGGFISGAGMNLTGHGRHAGALLSVEGVTPDPASGDIVIKVGSATFRSWEPFQQYHTVTQGVTVERTQSQPLPTPDTNEGECECSANTVQEQPGHVLYCIISNSATSGNYFGDMTYGHTILNNEITNVLTDGSTITKITIHPGATLQADLSGFNQIWVVDLNANTDVHPTQLTIYRQIADWWLERRTDIICDGRWISSLWKRSNSYRPNDQLVRNFFYNLKIAGGGLLLATDHATSFTQGINKINEYIGISAFWGSISATYLDVDMESSLLKWPKRADLGQFSGGPVGKVWDDSSASNVPQGQQTNGVVLLPLGFHNGDENRPGISTTITGGAGFLVNFTVTSGGTELDSCQPSAPIGSVFHLSAMVASHPEDNYNLASFTWTWTLDGTANLARCSQPTLSIAASEMGIGTHRLQLKAVESSTGYTAFFTVCIGVLGFLNDISASEAFSPEFDPEVSDYYLDAELPFFQTNMQVSGTTQTPESTFVRIDGEAVESGASITVSLKVDVDGSANHYVLIEAVAGAVSIKYRIYYRRKPSTDSRLGAIRMRPGDIDFSPDVFAYTVPVPYVTTSVSFWPQYTTTGQKIFINDVEYIPVVQQTLFPRSGSVWRPEDQQEWSGLPLPRPRGYSYSLFVNPDGLDSNWRAVLHRGEDRELPFQRIRRPALFFPPNSLTPYIGSSTDAPPRDGQHTSIQGTTELPTGSWTHIMWTHGGGKLQLYINGTLDVSSDQPTPFSSDDPLKGYSNFYEAKAAYVYQLQVFDAVLDPEDVQFTYGNVINNFVHLPNWLLMDGDMRHVSVYDKTRGEEVGIPVHRSFAHSMVFDSREDGAGATLSQASNDRIFTNGYVFRLSVYFYDNQPGDSRNDWISIGANSASGIYHQFGLGVYSTTDKYRYWDSPGAGWVDTTVARKLGWRLFELIGEPDQTVTLRIDGVQVHKTASYDTLMAGVSMRGNSGSLGIWSPIVVDRTLTPDSKRRTVRAPPMPKRFLAKQLANEKRTIGDLPVGETDVTIRTVAQDQTTESVYVITVVRDYSSNARLKSITVSGFAVTPDFDSDSSQTYSVEVPNHVTSVSMNTEAQDGTATIDFDGTAIGNVGSVSRNVDVGSNSFTITVLAQDQETTRSYVIVVSRAASQNTELASLSLDQECTVSGDYFCNYDYPGYGDQCYGDGPFYMDGPYYEDEPYYGNDGPYYGDCYFGQEVFKRHGKSRASARMRLHMRRNERNIARKTTLGEIDDFRATRLQYFTVIAHAQDHICVEASVADDTASFQVVDADNLDVGDNTVKVIVTAQAGNTAEYLINVRRRSNDSSLEYLEVDDYDLQPEFHPSTYEYGLDDNVLYDYFFLQLYAEPNHWYSNVLYKSFVPDEGSNTVGALVIAEDCNTQEYTVDVYRMSNNYYIDDVSVADALDSDGEPYYEGGCEKNPYDDFGDNHDRVTRKRARARKSSIKLTEIGVKPIEDGFNEIPRIFDYFCYQFEVANPVNSTTISMVAEHHGALIAYAQHFENELNVEVEVGLDQNCYEFLSLAEDQRYFAIVMVCIFRKPNEDPRLSSLEVSDLSLDFDPDTYDYTLEVEYLTRDVTLTAVPIHPASDMYLHDEVELHAGEQSDLLDLEIGDNEFAIHVFPEAEGFDAQYIVRINRLQSDHKNLRSLEMHDSASDSGEIHYSPSFSEEGSSYSATVDNLVSFMSIWFKLGEIEEEAGAYAELYGDHVYGEGEVELCVGSNSFTLTITAADESSRDISIDIEREPSPIDTLALMEPFEGEFDQEFEPTTTEYTMTVPNHITTMSVYVEASHDRASVQDVINGFAESGEGDPCTGGTEPGVSLSTDELELLVYHDNRFEFEVTSESGSSRTYTLIVTREPSDDATLSLLSFDGIELQPSFEPEQDEYSMIVLFETHDTTVSLETNHPVATFELEVNGTSIDADSLVDMPVGPAEFVITTTAEDYETSITYSVQITRLPSTNAKLQHLACSVGALTPSFDPLLSYYEVPVTNDVTSATLTAELSHDKASMVSGIYALENGGTTDPVDLVVGNNMLQVFTTAQDEETSRLYTVNVIRDPSDDDSAQIAVNSTTAPVFEIEDREVSWSVAHGVTKIEITAEATHPVARVWHNANGVIAAEDRSITVVRDVHVYDNQFVIHTIAEDNVTMGAYVLNVYREPSSDARLDALRTTLHETLTPAFDPDVFSYDVVLQPSESQLRVKGTPVHVNASLAVDEAQVGHDSYGPTSRHPYHESQIDVVGTAQDGESTQDYTINVYRISDISSLSSLSTNVGALSPSFHPSVLSYSLSVRNEIDEATVTAAVTDTGYGSIAMQKAGGANAQTVASGATSTAFPLVTEFNNQIEVIVTAEDGVTTTQYEINIERQLASNANLGSLSPSVGAFGTAFSTATLSYELELDFEVTAVTFTAATVHPDATVQSDGVDPDSSISVPVSDLPVGDTQVTFFVRAEDFQTSSTYVVNIIRQSDNRAGVASLVPSVSALNETFNTSEYAYSIVVDSDEDQWTLTASTLAETATLEFAGFAGATLSGENATSATVHVPFGSSRVVVTGVAQDGVTQVSYTVSVYRKRNIADLERLSLFVEFVDSDVDNSVAYAPSFSADAVDYSYDAPNRAIGAYVSAFVKAGSQAVMSVGGQALGAGEASASIPLAVGVGADVGNTIAVLVTAEDGKTTKSYEVVVNRAFASDATLSALSVSTGQVRPLFAPTSTQYSVDVDNDVSVVEVSAQVAHPQASCSYEMPGEPGADPVVVQGHSISFNVTVPVGAVEVAIQTTAEDGTTLGSYVVSIQRAQNSLATLASLVVQVEGAADPVDLAPTFSPERSAFSAVVSNDVVRVHVTASTSHPGAGAQWTHLTTPSPVVPAGAIDIDVDLVPGFNALAITSVAENGVSRRVTTLTIQRLLPSDSRLSGLSSPFAPFQPAPNTTFDSEVFEYNATAENEFESVVWQVIARDSHAYISVFLGASVTPALVSTNQSLSYTHNNVRVDRVNLIRFQVTAGDGSTSLYTVRLSRKPAIDARAASIDVNGQSVALEEEVLFYTVQVPNEEDHANITVATVQEDASVVVGGGDVLATGEMADPVALAVGPNEITCAVTAQDGVTSLDYVLTVQRAPSADTSLDKLTIELLKQVRDDGGASDTIPDVQVIDLDVASGSTGFQIDAANEQTSIRVTASTTHASGAVRVYVRNELIEPVSGSGDSGDDVASEEALITEDQNQVVYVINLDVGGEGANDVAVQAIAEDGVTSTFYNVTAVRAASTDTGLLDVFPSRGSLVPTFIPSPPQLDGSNVVDDPRLAYSVSVREAVTSIALKAEVRHPQATLSIEGVSVASGELSDEMPLVVGVNTKRVVVTAEDGSTSKEWTVAVTRRPSTNAYLKDLYIVRAEAETAGAIAPTFDAFTFRYSAGFSSDRAAVQVVATSAHGAASIALYQLESAPAAGLDLNAINVTGLDAQELESDSASDAQNLTATEQFFLVRVTAGDGETTQSYVLKVVRRRNGDSRILAVSFDPPVWFDDDNQFDPDRVGESFSGVVTSDVDSVRITVVGEHPSMTTYINYKVVDASGAEVAVEQGFNPVVVTGRSQSGRSSSQYRFQIERPSLILVSERRTSGSTVQENVGRVHHAAAGLVSIAASGAARALQAVSLVCGGSNLDVSDQIALTSCDRVQAVGSVEQRSISVEPSTAVSLSEGRQLLGGCAVSQHLFFAGGFKHARAEWEYFGERAETAMSDVVDVFTSTELTEGSFRMSQPRSSLSCVGFGDYALFAGGAIVDSSGSAPVVRETALVEYIDAKSRKEILKGVRTAPFELSVARSRVAAVSLGAFTFFAGGFTSAPVSAPAGVSNESVVHTTTASGGLPSTGPTNNGGFYGVVSVIDIVRRSGIDISTASLVRHFTRLSQARADITAVAHGERVFFYGGWTADGQTSDVLDIVTPEVNFNTGNVGFSLLTVRLSTPVAFAATAIINNDVMFVGGLRRNALGVESVVGTTVVVNSADLTSRMLPAPADASQFKSGARGVTVDGKTVHVGGYSNSDVDVLASDVVLSDRVTNIGFAAGSDQANPARPAPCVHLDFCSDNGVCTGIWPTETCSCFDGFTGGSCDTLDEESIGPIDALSRATQYGAAGMAGSAVAAGAASSVASSSAVAATSAASGFSMLPFFNYLQLVAMTVKHNTKLGLVAEPFEELNYFLLDSPNDRHDPARDDSTWGYSHGLGRKVVLVLAVLVAAMFLPERIWVNCCMSMRIRMNHLVVVMLLLWLPLLESTLNLPMSWMAMSVQVLVILGVIWRVAVRKVRPTLTPQVLRYLARGEGWIGLAEQSFACCAGCCTSALVAKEERIREKAAAGDLAGPAHSSSSRNIAAVAQTGGTGGTEVGASDGESENELEGKDKVVERPRRRAGWCERVLYNVSAWGKTTCGPCTDCSQRNTCRVRCWCYTDRSLTKHEKSRVVKTRRRLMAAASSRDLNLGLHATASSSSLAMTPGANGETVVHVGSTAGATAQLPPGSTATATGTPTGTQTHSSQSASASDGESFSESVHSSDEEYSEYMEEEVVQLPEVEMLYRRLYEPRDAWERFQYSGLYDEVVYYPPLRAAVVRQRRMSTLAILLYKVRSALTLYFTFIELSVLVLVAATAVVTDGQRQIFWILYLLGVLWLALVVVYPYRHGYQLQKLVGYGLLALQLWLIKQIIDNRDMTAKVLTLVLVIQVAFIPVSWLVYMLFDDRRAIEEQRAALKQEWLDERQRKEEEEAAKEPEPEPTLGERVEEQRQEEIEMQKVTVFEEAREARLAAELAAEYGSTDGTTNTAAGGDGEGDGADDSGDDDNLGFLQRRYNAAGALTTTTGAGGEQDVDKLFDLLGSTATPAGRRKRPNFAAPGQFDDLEDAMHGADDGADDDGEEAWRGSSDTHMETFGYETTHRDTRGLPDDEVGEDSDAGEDGTGTGGTGFDEDGFYGTDEAILMSVQGAYNEFDGSVVESSSDDDIDDLADI